MNSDDILSLPRLMACMKRELRLIAISVICFVGLAVLYCLIAPSKYTAHTSILLDPTQAATVSEISSKAESRFEDASIVSQIEIVKSRRVALKAMEYLSSGGKISDANLNDIIDEEKLANIIDGLKVYREGESYVLTITYTSTDPQISAGRANAFAQAYLYDQVNSFSEGSLQTSVWLKAKIDSLRKQSIDANRAIQEFRKAHNMIQSNGESANEQQLNNINNRLGDAKARVASAKARYIHSKEIVQQKNISAAVAAAFDNDVINNVRAQYLEDQQKLLELRRTLGGDHKAVKNLQNKLSESRNVIFSEMRRLSESHKGDYEVALAEQASLEKSLNELFGVELNNDGEAFELEALEKEAEAYASLHDEFLEKYELVQQQQSFPVAQSRTITKAVPPANKSHPKTIIILGLSLILGVGVGVLLALLKDNFDASFKRAGQIENTAGMHFLGFFPSLKNKAMIHSSSSDLLDGEYTQSIDVSRSLQAETCRNIKATLDRKSDAGCKVIGMTADNPNVGKSVTAANLALFIAKSKNKCLLIDGDLCNPSLSGDNFTNITQGLHAVLLNDVAVNDAIIQDSKTGLFVLPSETSKKDCDMTLVTSKNMHDLVESCKENFDYIIVDLPSLSASSDASCSSLFVDYFLLVLEWGKSKPNNLEFHLKLSEISKEQILGVVLGQADMKEMTKNYGHTVYPEYTKV